MKYTYRPEYCLPLSIPLEATINNSEVEEWEKKQAESDNKECVYS